jgi:hypothetical protein
MDNLKPEPSLHQYTSRITHYIDLYEFDIRDSVNLRRFLYFTDNGFYTHELITSIEEVLADHRDIDLFTLFLLFIDDTVKMRKFMNLLISLVEKRTDRLNAVHPSPETKTKRAKQTNK